jgi:nucleoside-diphosphate-sugar epimerase
VKGEEYTCFLKKDTALPMMYIDDAIRATIELMDSPKHKINIRTAYNLAAISFTPDEIYNKILERVTGFKIKYEPDFRQQIAESWSESIDDSHAREDWGWKHEYDLHKMVDEMLTKLQNT